MKFAPVPDIDCLNVAVELLRKLKDSSIPVYFIAGSHDFSPSGKTMLDVIEHAGFGVCVARGEELPDNRLKLHFTVDARTGAKITGMIGKKRGLEHNLYHLLAREHLEKEPGFKIFMFHSAISELKPKGLEDMDAMALSLLPSGFDYYAGGHVHVVEKHSFEAHKNIVYPGPVFPNNFSEIEKLRHGSFVIFDNGSISHIPLSIHPVVCISIDAENKNPFEAEQAVRLQLNNLTNAIVTIRIAGCLSHGSPSDIRWKELFGEAYSKNAHIVLKNTNALLSRELEAVIVKEDNIDELEDSLLKEHSAQFKLSQDDIMLAKSLMQVLCAEKQDGERVADFESRLGSELDVLFKQAF